MNRTLKRRIIIQFTADILPNRNFKLKANDLVNKLRRVNINNKGNAMCF
jgi:hypothetical protein